jgi:FkbH-like protein
MAHSESTRGTLKITEALKILQNAPAGAEAFPVQLACGFTPLHLQTFLAAHLQNAFPGRRVQILTGLYGDLAGTLEQLPGGEAQAAVIPLEWFDLDPRLGFRQTGGWGPADLADLVVHASAMLQRLEQALDRVTPDIAVALSLPTLPLPPVFHTAGWQSGEAELRLQERLSAFAVCVSRRPHISVVNRQLLDRESPPAGRYDLKSDLLTGLPYALAHADCAAAALARLIAPFAPKKGLITDLDDTLWSGIVGEIGADAVAWDLESHHAIHGLYQQVLRALAEQGVLIGIASKNDPRIAGDALERKDLLLPPDRIFPVEVHWEAKSGSAARILRAWNIAADSVVFVDDSPMEIAEVQAAYPDMHCLLFPKSDYAAAEAFLRTLRDLFAKPRIGEEDALRLDSIRRNAALRQMTESASAAPEEFLRQMKARITLDFRGAASDPRTLELVNKTNQFNLNGRRYSESEWRKCLEDPNAFVVSVSYEDKFGPLGKIAVVRGSRSADSIAIDTWVMSCRAFARRIEHHCLKRIFDRFPAQEAHLDFAPTPKNKPTQDFFCTFLGERPGGPFSLSKACFEKSCPALYHEVSILDD